MNRLRNEKVIVEFPIEEEIKDAYKTTKTGIYLPEEEKQRMEKKAHLIKGTVVLVGHLINPQDIKVGDSVYAKKSQGERLSPDKEEWIFHEQAILGND